MKAEELQIGDWVLWKNKPVQIAQISGIKYSFGHIEVVLAHCGSGFLESHDIKSINPIPIVPEILGKNEFKLRFDGWIWCADDENEYQDYIFIQFRRGGEDGLGVRRCDFNFLNNAKALFFNIQYVHQLQQLLRLCGINKEIILEDKE